MNWDVIAYGTSPDRMQEVTTLFHPHTVPSPQAHPCAFGTLTPEDPMTPQLHTGAVGITPPTCSAPGCTHTQIHARGQCKACYQRAWIRAKRRARGIRSTRTPHRQRAENIRKWLAFGHQPLAELAWAMQCSRFALHHTLSRMPDVEKVTMKGQRAKAVRLATRAAAQRCA